MCIFCKLKPNSITLAGSELVRSWFEPDSVMEFGFEPAPNQLAFKAGSKLVGDQLRTSFEPASVMEFGFYRAAECRKISLALADRNSRAH